MEDVAKRAAYRKAHGLDKNEGFGGWTAKSDAQVLGPGIPVGDGSDVSATDPTGEQELRTKRPLKKWLGIW